MSSDKKFVWSKTGDIDDVPVHEIARFLTEPLIDGAISSKGFR